MEEAIWAGITVGHLLARIPEREQAIVELRMEGYTLREVGTAMGVGPERVRQLEMRAMRRMGAALVNSNSRVATATADLPKPIPKPPEEPVPVVLARLDAAHERARTAAETSYAALAALAKRYPEPPRVISRGEAAYYNHHLAPDPYPRRVVLPEGGTLLERLAEHARRYAEGDYGAQP
jgi:DNA-binding CsgD family transcriptional regulator